MENDYSNCIVTKEFLDSNPNAIFVFGDNLLGRGTGGAARLRHHPQSYGFVTKKFPNNQDTSFYHPADYQSVFNEEMAKFIAFAKDNTESIFYISKLGAGLANRYHIWEKIIRPQFKTVVEQFIPDRVIFLWEREEPLDQPN